MERTLTYFVSDVHLGLDVADMKGREERFVSFLRSIPADRTATLYLLGDIWDFWYEYHDVVPKGYVRVFSALLDLLDGGVRVVFFPGNHDIWCYHYLQDLGLEVVEQTLEVKIGGKTFCLGHGDGLGPGMRLYKLMRWGFHNRVLQALFSALHPWVAFRLGKGWSKKSRLAKNVEYVFRGEEEPLYKFACGYALSRPVDFFVFGHFHTHVDMVLPGGARLLILKDWMNSSPSLVYDSSTGGLTYRSDSYFRFWGRTGILGYCPKMDQ